ncbi:MAG: PAS domain S-box protein [Leptolyngbyaceae cyanobacterium SL_1_1]|nr:PAS domain S-box protein [Leptolyngbyaceae cyanobacterium SL_1_1]
MEETASTLGEAFFPSLVKHLAQALGVRYVTITEQVEVGVLATVAAYDAKTVDHAVPWFRGAIAGSPCKLALEQGHYSCSAGVQQQFPNCLALLQLEVESYFAVALLDSTGLSIGLLSVMDDRPFPCSKAVEKILRIFAMRASAELERQRITQALQTSEENFRAIFEQAAVGICRTNLAGEFVQVNQRLCDMLGYTEAELLQMNFQQITYLEDAHLGLDLRQQLQQGLVSAFSLEKRYLRKNGEILWTNLSISAIYSTADDSFWSLTVAEDITARKQAEAQLGRSEERFRRIAANVPGAIYQFILHADGQRQIPYISDRIQEILELDPEMIQQSAAVLFDRVHPEDQILLQESIAVSARRLICWSWEGRFISASGCVVWVKGIAEPGRQPDGSILWDGLLIDISRRRRAEAEIQKAIAKERELNELKSRFVATTSHEFRTPLAVIASSAGILKDFGHKLDEANKQKHFDAIQTYVRQTTKLLDDLLFINQPGTNQLSFQPVSLNLLVWFHQMGEKMRLEAPRHQLRWVTTEAATAGLTDSVCLDQHLLSRVLSNLVSNSIQYSPEKTQVEVTLDLETDWIYFSIKDIGIGILARDRPYLFEPFYRGRNVEHIPGTGLGLSIARQCVDLHRGRISFDTQVGEGTTFYCWLPLVFCTTAGLCH